MTRWVVPFQSPRWLSFWTITRISEVLMNSLWEKLSTFSNVPRIVCLVWAVWVVPLCALSSVHSLRICTVQRALTVLLAWQQGFARGMLIILENKDKERIVYRIPNLWTVVLSTKDFVLYDFVVYNLLVGVCWRLFVCWCLLEKSKIWIHRRKWPKLGVHQRKLNQILVGALY